MGTRRWGCAAVMLEDGQVIVVGGSNGTNILSTSEVLNHATNTWSPGPNLDSPRYACAALPLSNGRIFVIGGNSGTTVESSLSTTEVIDLASGTSTPGPVMSC